MHTHQNSDCLSALTAMHLVQATVLHSSTIILHPLVCKDGEYYNVQYYSSFSVLTLLVGSFDP